MLKVYLLTFHGSVNYGAVLQAYALAKTIKTLGHDCKVIDYNRVLHHKNYLRISGGSWKSSVVQILALPEKYILHKKFDAFSLRNMPLTTKSFNGFNALSENDFEKDALFIVGSDQIWNCELTESNYHYYLDFTHSPNKYSYAASFGVTDLSRWKDKEKVLALLKDFRRISVREESGRTILENELGIESQVVCDPTFLLSSEQWKKIAQVPTGLPKQYVLLFMLTYNEKLVEAAKKLADEKQLPVLNLAYTVKSIPGIRSVRNVSPQEWLGLIANAATVFTNSFHGFALSLNMHRQVWVALTKGTRNSRIVDLANRYGVTNRILTDDIMLYHEIDYKSINKAIENDVLHSLDYLKEIIDGKEN